ncbi:MAG: CehA/McbA family metallohydrolase [Thermoplasmata archaeon]|jgi:hypothetical protein
MDDVIYSQLHAHSRYSVNRFSGEGAIHRYVWPLERQVVKYLMLKPEKISRMARVLGLSYVAITDHNTLPGYEDDRIIRSEEWGQRKGHANFINLKSAIPPECGYFRGIEPDEKIDFYVALNRARENGAMVVINHPFKRDSWLWGNDTYSLVDALEIWNGPWNSENEMALKLWNGLLEEGVKILPMAGSDFHTGLLDRLDMNLIVTEKSDDKHEFLKNLRASRYSITRDLNSPYIFLHDDLEYSIGRCTNGTEMRIITYKKNEKIRDPPCRGNLNNISPEVFLRLELWREGEPLSFSVPIFFKH